MAIPDSVYVVIDTTGVIEVCTVKAMAEATAEKHSGSQMEEHKLVKGTKRAAEAGSDGASAPKKSKKAGHKNTEKAYEGVDDRCLVGKSFFFAGRGMKLTHKALHETVNNHGGTVAAELKDADNVVFSKAKNVGAGQHKIIEENGLLTMDEEQFKAWVETGDEPTSDDLDS